MDFAPLIRPHVRVHPTLDTAIWFLHLRWVAVAGQLLTLAVVAWVLRIHLPIMELLALIGVIAVSNTAYSLWLNRLNRGGLARADRLPTASVVSGLMLVDILVLTGMLYLSAGIANPFSLFYFVNIAVAGAIITPAWSWGIWGATVAGVFVLLLRSEPIAELSASSLMGAANELQLWTIPKIGFLVSFATCSGVITYFITVLTGELRQREKALQDAEDARIRNRQLEALATLATGAAHELATPLSTIAVIATELSRALEKQGAPKSVTEDVALIRSELNRCRQILDRMTSAAGEPAGERLQPVAMEEFLQEVIVGLREPKRVLLNVTTSMLGQSNLLPLQAAAQALRNLVQNALDASQPGSTVSIVAAQNAKHWTIEVVDRGDGMTPEVIDRIGEPFFTTKEPGRGMGLGLYLTQNVLRRLNGTVSFESRPGHGTVATVVLPTHRGSD
ncbi:MAG: HAMP domain-containing histidine kinase [Planctomycetales bacterium]|nr:HAMP domain-containing histidine kinase [Planctomycetales bacterium]